MIPSITQHHVFDVPAAAPSLGAVTRGPRRWNGRPALWWVGERGFRRRVDEAALPNQDAHTHTTHLVFCCTPHLHPPCILDHHAHPPAASSRHKQQHPAIGERERQTRRNGRADQQEAQPGRHRPVSLSYTAILLPCTLLCAETVYTARRIHCTRVFRQHSWCSSLSTPLTIWTRLGRLRTHLPPMLPYLPTPRRLVS